MKPLIYSACIILSFGFAAANAGTEVYMSMDAEGNVIFSDMPSDDSQRHEVRELPSLPAFNPEPPPTPEPAKRTEAAFSYTSLAIVSPRDREPLPTGAGGNVEVSGVLSPALRDSDNLVLLDNGAIIAKGDKPHSICKISTVANILCNYKYATPKTSHSSVVILS